MTKIPEIRTKKWIRAKKIVLSAIIILGAVAIFIAPLVHTEISRTNPKVEAYKKELNDQVAQIDAQIEVLDKNYRAGNITSEEAYLTLVDKLQPSRKELVKKNKELLSQKVDSERIFGWKTWRALANGWGIRLPYLFFAFIISVLILLVNTKERTLAISFNFLQIACYTIALYEQVWSFWPSEDLPLEAYRLLIIGLCLLVSIGGVFFVKNYIYKLFYRHEKISFLETLLETSLKIENKK